MKKLMALVVVAVMVLGVVPVFTVNGYAAGSGDDKPKTLFQQWSDKINTPLEMEVKPLKKIDTFQDLSNGIAEGSAKAKKTSLRTPKACK